MDGAAGTASGGHGLRNKLHNLKEKLKESHISVEDTHSSDLKVKAIHMKHQIGKFGNLFNANHRHDEKHEQETDGLRTKIAESHRFGSFAPERDGNKIKWYVDGRNYYWVRSFLGCPRDFGRLNSESGCFGGLGARKGNDLH